MSLDDYFFCMCTGPGFDPQSEESTEQSTEQSR